MKTDTEEIIKDLDGSNSSVEIDDCDFSQEFNDNVKELNKRRELLFIDEMESMCLESLDPETYLKWVSVKAVLFNTREYLKM